MEIPASFQEPTDLLQFYKQGQLSAHEWWYLRTLDYYVQAFLAGAVKPTIKKMTDNIARCSLCGDFARAGIPQFRVVFDGQTRIRQFHSQCLEHIEEEVINAKSKSS